MFMLLPFPINDGVNHFFGIQLGGPDTTGGTVNLVVVNVGDVPFFHAPDSAAATFSDYAHRIINGEGVFDAVNLGCVFHGGNSVLVLPPSYGLSEAVSTAIRQPTYRLNDKLQRRHWLGVRY